MAGAPKSLIGVWLFRRWLERHTFLHGILDFPAIFVPKSGVGLNLRALWELQFHHLGGMMEEDDIAPRSRLGRRKNDPVEAWLVHRCQEVGDSLCRQIVESFIVWHNGPCHPKFQGSQERGPFKSPFQGGVENAARDMYVFQRSQVEESQRPENTELCDGNLAPDRRADFRDRDTCIGSSIKNRDSLSVHSPGSRHVGRRRAEMEVWAAEGFLKPIFGLEYSGTI
ncbi:hypothetical protein LMG9673_04590 [Ralstonia pseudosolanacearum]|nr:hypothetical protein LMG9673_04590 [Ralstonia pseudosolanacearum]